MCDVAPCLALAGILYLLLVRLTPVLLSCWVTFTSLVVAGLPPGGSSDPALRLFSRSFCAFPSLDFAPPAGFSGFTFLCCHPSVSRLCEVSLFPLLCLWFRSLLWARPGRRCSHFLRAPLPCPLSPLPQRVPPSCRMVSLSWFSSWLSSASMVPRFLMSHLPAPSCIYRAVRSSVHLAPLVSPSPGSRSLLGVSCARFFFALLCVFVIPCPACVFSCSSVAFFPPCGHRVARSVSCGLACSRCPLVLLPSSSDRVPQPASQAQAQDQGPRPKENGLIKFFFKNNYPQFFQWPRNLGPSLTWEINRSNG